MLTMLNCSRSLLDTSESAFFIEPCSNSLGGTTSSFMTSLISIAILRMSNVAMLELAGSYTLLMRSRTITSTNLKSLMRRLSAFLKKS